MILKISLQNNRNGWFYVFLIILLSCLFVRFAFQLLIPEILLIALLAGMSLMGGRDEIMAVCVCLLPLYTVVPYYYILAICILVYVLKFPNDCKIDISIVPILLIVLWELFHCFAGVINLNAVIATILLYVFFAFLLSLRNICFDYGFIVRCFSLVVFAMMACLFAQLLIHSGFNIVRSFANMQRLGMLTDESNNVTVILNPNTLGIMSVLAISGLLQLRSSDKKKRNTDIALMISLLILGTMTISRTYVFCLLIMTCLFIFANKKDLRTKMKWIGWIVLTVALVLACLIIFFPMVLETFMLRFQVKDLSSGRNDLFALFNDFILSAPEIYLWGIGLLDFGNKIITTYAVATQVPHNGIQEILIAWGAPGLFLFALLIWMFVWRSRQENRSQSLTNFIPFVILLAKVQVGQWITSTYTMLAFTLIYLSLCANLDRWDGLE